MWKQTKCVSLTVVVLVGLFVAALAPHQASAAVGTNPQMAFQGKVVLANGTNIADGTYNVEYKIYKGGTATGGGVLQWTEDYLIGSTGGITVANGVFSVNLGAITSLASVDFNSDTLWLSLQVGNTSSCTILTTFQANCSGDGEMTPYIRLTSVPYAFNSQQLGGISSSGYAVLANANTFAGLTTLNAGATILGTTGINTTGTAATTIGNAGAALSLASTGLNISTGGALTGVTGLTTSGFYTQTGTSANTFSGATTFNATGTALTITNAASLGSLSVGAITATGNFSQTGSTTLSTGTGAISLNGSTTLAANQGLTLTTGTGTIVQTYTTPTTGTAQTETITNSNATATVTTVTANNIALVGGTNANAAANILNGLNFANVTPVTNNAFYGLNFGTGFNDLLRYNGTQLISGTGLLQSAAVSGTYGNLTGTGALVSGSIATGFGTISTANNITTSTTLQGATVNATTALTLAGANINTSGTLTNVAYLAQANTFTSTNAFNGVTTVTNNLTVNTGTANVVSITSGTNVPTADQLTIDNTASTGVTTAVNGAYVKYKAAGTTAAEGAGIRIDYSPTTVAGTSIWDGVRIVESAAPGSGVVSNGIKLTGINSGAGVSTAVAVGTGWDIGLDVQSGGMQLAALASNPAIPPAGNIRAYAYKIAGRTMLKILSPSGTDYALQPSLAQQSVFLVTPGTGTVTTTYSATGGSVLAAGTLAATGGATTEVQGFMGNIASAATIGSAAGVSNGVNQYYTGSIASGANGFFYFARISLPDALAKYNNTTTGSRLFFGLSDQTLATMVASDNPAGNYAGITYSGVRDTGGAFQFMTKNGTTQTVATTGVTLAVSKTYDMYVYVSSQGTTINWRIDNLTDGTAPVEGTQTLTLPTNSVAMKSMIDIAPLEAVIHNLRFQRVYVETDR